MTNEQISQAYQVANAEKSAAAEWLIEQGICTSRIDAALYLAGRAGAYAMRIYRESRISA